VIQKLYTPIIITIIYLTFRLFTIIKPLQNFTDNSQKPANAG